MTTNDYYLNPIIFSQQWIQQQKRTNETDKDRNEKWPRARKKIFAWIFSGLAICLVYLDTQWMKIVLEKKRQRKRRRRRKIEPAKPSQRKKPK